MPKTESLSGLHYIQNDNFFEDILAIDNNKYILQVNGNYNQLRYISTAHISDFWPKDCYIFDRDVIVKQKNTYYYRKIKEDQNADNE